jgi:hypothetical protein
MREEHAAHDVHWDLMSLNHADLSSTAYGTKSKLAVVFSIAQLRMETIVGRSLSTADRMVGTVTDAIRVSEFCAQTVATVEH